MAAFFDAGGNMPGGLPFTPWAADLKKARTAANAKDNPDALCLPMGILQFHLQPQPRMIVQTPKLILHRVRGQLRHSSHLSRWPQVAAPRRAAAVVVRLFGWAMGRGHAGGRDQQPPRHGG